MKVNIKNLISLAIATTVAVISFPTTAQAGNYNRQVYSQQQRINQGINYGTISPRENAILLRRQNSLNTAILRDIRDGRGLTRAERYKLNRRADNISRSIYRFKRN